MSLPSSSGSTMPPPHAPLHTQATFVWLGRGLLTLLVVVMLGSLGIQAAIGMLKRSASTYVVESVRAMTDPWNPKALLERALPQILPADAEVSVPSVFARFARLGHLQSLGTPIGRIGHGAFPGTPINGFWADYRIAATFDNGPAEMEVVLQRVGDGWRIGAFVLESPFFQHAGQ